MEINANFAERAVVHSDQLPWVASPMQGVDRRMLDRIGGEVARATTIVRYAPNSHFSPHTHDGGEEFIVLDGVFQDEHGDFPTGSYVRNPPTSSHTPGSEAGCVIFVKLWQFDPDDRTQLRIDMNAAAAEAVAGRAGARATALFADAHEEVRLEHWDANSTQIIDLPAGGELLVLDGGFTEGGDQLGKHAWLRLPPGSQLAAKAGPDGARVWLKTGHLNKVTAPAA